VSDVPKVFTPDEAHELIPIVSANWLKVHARNGDIPSVKIGRGLGFTAAQLGEIVLKYTQRAGSAAPSRAPAARSGGGGSVTQLEARAPRRKRVS